MRISDRSSDVCSSDLLQSKQPLPFGEPEKKEKEPASDSDLAEDLEIDEDSDNAEEDVDLDGDDDLGVAGRDKEEESRRGLLSNLHRVPDSTRSPTNPQVPSSLNTFSGLYVLWNTANT